MSEDNGKFKPFVPADSTLPEMTATSIILGILMSIIFVGENA